MKRIFKYITVSFFMFFVFIFNVNAECTYQERKELLEQAKNIEAYFQPDVDNNKFVFYLYNLNDNLYITLENLSTNISVDIYNYQFDTDYYTFDETNVSDVVNYKMTIYSNKRECYSNQLTTKNIKKGIINKFYKEEVCDGIEDYKYCVPILNSKFRLSDEDVYKNINEYKKSIAISEKKFVEEKFGMDDLINLLVDYWYIIGIVLLIIIIIFVIRYINKKRGEL